MQKTDSNGMKIKEGREAKERTVTLGMRLKKSHTMIIHLLRVKNTLTLLLAPNVSNGTHWVPQFMGVTQWSGTSLTRISTVPITKMRWE